MKDFIKNIKWEIAFFMLTRYDLQALSKYVPKSVINWIYRNSLGI